MARSVDSDCQRQAVPTKDRRGRHETLAGFSARGTPRRGCPLSGLVSYRAGLSAEDSVAAHYIGRDYCLRAQRWRGGAGEIDLIFGRGEELVFTEVKKGKDFAGAAARLRPAQQQRILLAAQEYMASMPNGLDTACRFDVALVDGTGRIEVLENAFP